MNIIEKLSAIQRELLAPKAQFNSFGKYSYRSCEDILEALKPLMKKYKVAVTITDDVVEVGGRIYIKATASVRDTEEDGCAVSTSAFAREAEEKKGMDDSQITGTASSYARKYALNGLFAIDDVKDADEREERLDAAKEMADEDKRERATRTAVISPETARAFASKCRNEGVNTSKICAYFKVPSVENLTYQMHDEIIRRWKEAKEVWHE